MPLHKRHSRCRSLVALQPWHPYSPILSAPNRLQCSASHQCEFGGPVVLRMRPMSSPVRASNNQCFRFPVSNASGSSRQSSRSGQSEAPGYTSTFMLNVDGRGYAHRFEPRPLAILSGDSTLSRSTWAASRFAAAPLSIPSKTPGRPECGFRVRKKRTPLCMPDRL